MCIFDFYTKAMNTPNTQSKSLMRKILFLEITGIISLLLIAAVVYLILSFGLLDVRFLALPAAGVVMVAVLSFLPFAIHDAICIKFISYIPMQSIPGPADLCMRWPWQ